MIDLLSEVQKKYKFLTVPVPELKVGVYEIKKYFLTENSKFVKVLYFDTDLGFYQTKSMTLIGSMYGIVGRIFDNAIKNGETVKVEIVNHRSFNGYMRLAFRTV